MRSGRGGTLRTYWMPHAERTANRNEQYAKLSLTGGGGEGTVSSKVRGGPSTRMSCIADDPSRPDARGRHVKGGSLMTSQRCASRFPVTSILALGLPLMCCVVAATSPGFAQCSGNETGTGEGVRSSTQPCVSGACPEAAANEACIIARDPPVSPHRTSARPRIRVDRGDPWQGRCARHAGSRYLYVSEHGEWLDLHRRPMPTHTLASVRLTARASQVWMAGPTGKGERLSNILFHQSGATPPCGHVHVHQGVGAVFYDGSVCSGVSAAPATALTITDGSLPISFAAVDLKWHVAPHDRQSR